MTSVLYIIPYFGNFPKIFPLWLNSCKNNPTINWLIFTDDRTDYHYPHNVKVIYTTFDAVKSKIQNIFNYKICLNSPYKLCDYRVCYGEAFNEYIVGYDFWGFCDIDLIWGNIRSILTDDIFEKYDKIGYQGHSTLMRNTDYINKLFRKNIFDETIKKYLQSIDSCFTDEDFINRLFEHYNIPYYSEKTFANLSSLVYNFKLNHIDKYDLKKNKDFIFSYENGQLYRYSTINKHIYKDNFMYVHFLKRHMEVLVTGNSNDFLIVPNKLIKRCKIDCEFIKKANAPHYFSFALKHFRANAYKLNHQTIIPIFIKKIRGYFTLFTKY